MEQPSGLCWWAPPLPPLWAGRAFLEVLEGQPILPQPWARGRPGSAPPFPAPQGWSGVHRRGLGARPASHGPVARCLRVPGRQVHGFERPATRERPCGGDEPSSSLLGALGVPADVCSLTNTGSCSPVWDAALTVGKRWPWRCVGQTPAWMVSHVAGVLRPAPSTS